MTRPKSEIIKEKLSKILSLRHEIVDCEARAQFAKTRLHTLETELFDLMPHAAGGAVFFERFREGGSQLFCVEFSSEGAYGSPGRRVLFTQLNKLEDLIEP